MMRRNNRCNSSANSNLNVNTIMERRISSNSESSSIEPMDISVSNKTTSSSDGNNTSSLSTMAISKLSESAGHSDSDDNIGTGGGGICSEENDENIVRRENLRLHANNHIDTKMLRKKFRLMNNNNSNSSNNNNNNSTTIIPLTIDKNLSSIDSQDKKNSETFKCHICSKNLSSSSGLARHIQSHSFDTESPYKCNLCHITFTTLGNMHRHMKCHKLDGNDNNNNNDNRHNDDDDDNEDYISNDEYERGVSSDASSGNESRDSVNDNIRNNNNNNYTIGKRKNTNDGHDDGIISLKRKNYNNNNLINKNFTSQMIMATQQQQQQQQQKFCCPVCDRNDFINMLTLDNHMDKEHPSYQARCRHCDTVFKSHKALNGHRCTNSTNQSITQGFKDLTFIDFSSEKFPIIAKSVCEQTIRTPITSQKFECPKCYRAFPCSTAVDIHARECGDDADGGNDSAIVQDFSMRHNSKRTYSNSDNSDDDECKRDDFFANLDLLNKTSNTFNTSNNSSPRSTISSDIMRTPSLHHSMDSKDLADIQSIINVTSSSGGLLRQFDKPLKDHLGGPKVVVEEVEEAQDAFTAEFRKMKLRGEFPCKLCTAVFPNLRALKGHNRVHLSSAGAGPYRCNMCPYSIHDKAALIRHMRTHNGDRPYECAVCNYAFTTKANCERHLRNRHAKTTREEVKRAIIYHPSEDSSADEHHHSKKLTMFSSPDFNEDEDRIPKDRSTPVSSRLQDLLLPDNHHQRLAASLSPSPLKIQVKSLEKLIHPESIKSEVDEEVPEKKIPEPINDHSNRSEDEDDEEEGGNEETKPIDLSMDALDLSKKSKFDDTKPLNLLNNNIDELSFFEKNKQLFMAQQQFLNETLPKIDPSHYLQFYRNIMFPPPGFPIPPFLLQNPLLPPPNMGEVKDMRGQMAGGNLIYSQQSSSSPTPPLSIKSQSFDESPNKSGNNNESHKYSPIATPTSSHNNSAASNSMSAQNNQMSNGPVKMVIKNGVLMPKQKQRRYRTERPFACEHCSARFTLRSNMERHIKQQHPQFWAQRQRSGHNLLRRGSGPPPPPQQTTQQQQQQSSQQSIIPQSVPQQLTNQTNFTSISDQVKYAILAQQLKYNKDNKMGIPSSLVQSLNANSHMLQNNNNNNSMYENQNANDEEDDPQLVIDEDSQPEDLSKLESSPKNTATSTPNQNNVIEAKKIAETILEQAKKASSVMPVPHAPNNIESAKDFDLKISPNLIAKADNLPKYNLYQPIKTDNQKEEGDLVSVSRLVDNAFGNFFGNNEINTPMEHSDEDGLVASGSASESNTSGPEDNHTSATPVEPLKKKSAYSLAPNRVKCPYCQRSFPWSSSLRRHILTHTGQKPFKCSHCPLLFTTKSNCDRHLLRKHGNIESAMSVAVPIDENIPEPVIKKEPKEYNDGESNDPINQKSPKMSLSSSMAAANNTSPAAASMIMPNLNLALNLKAELMNNNNNNVNSSAPNNIPPVSTELPYKCHLCDGSFSDRMQCLEHIRHAHAQEFALLLAKGAIDADATAADNNNTNAPSQMASTHHNNSNETNALDDEIKDGKGKYPDYANRKVICAFCVRRFWSTEDLRRHMRTHSGERPFQCDICLRKFTLKHSMLRHQKKHSAHNNSQHQQNNSASDMSDDEPAVTSGQSASMQTNKMLNIPDLIPKDLAQWKLNQLQAKFFAQHNNGGGGSQELNTNSNNHQAPSPPSFLMSPFLQLQQRFASLAHAGLGGLGGIDHHHGGGGGSGDHHPDESDLIGNLLGISDQGILNRVLVSSADEAAKLLGVDK